MSMDEVTQQRRAEIVSLAYFIITLLLSGTVCVLSLLTNSTALQIESLHLLGGAGIWLLLLIVYHQRKLVAMEAVQEAELRRERHRTGGQLFEGEEEQLLLMHRRLTWMYRWVLGLGTFLLAGWHLIGLVPMGNWTFGRSVWEGYWPTIDRASIAMAFMGGVAFIAFLLSRYASGMARQPSWGMLRAGASYLFGNCIACVGLMVVLGFANAGNPVPERVCGHAIVILMMILSAEFVLNFVLDLYRPRHADEEPRPAFDSRFLGLFSEAGGIARSIAEAVNYQFGFEVSGTWFYQLLQKAIVPLLLFAVGSQILISSMVIVDPGSQAVIERLGKPLQKLHEGVKPLGPGLHLKLPWPIDRAYKYEVDKVQEVVVGFGTEAMPEEENDTGVVLWTTRRHGPLAEWNILVATKSNEPEAEERAAPSAQPTTQGQTGQSLSRSVPVSILKALLVVQYQVSDLYQYAYQYANVSKMLEGLAFRELTQYMATVDMNRILREDLLPATSALRERIAAAATERQLGVEIVFVGFRGAHPPAEVAKDFEAVVAAEQKKDAARQGALRQQNEVLTRVAGSRTLAEKIYDAIGALEKLERDQSGNRAAIELAQARVEGLLLGKSEGAGALGEAAQIINTARTRAYESLSKAQATTNAMAREGPGYYAAPDYYRRRRLLRAFSDAIRDLPKYVVAFVPKESPFIKIAREEKELIKFEAFKSEEGKK
jgi:modulator of FtsH protease HflK